MKKIYLLLLLLLLPLISYGQVAIGGESPNASSVFWLSWHESQLDSLPDGFEETLLSGKYVWMFTEEVKISANIEFLSDDSDLIDVRNYTPGEWEYDGLRHLYIGDTLDNIANEPNGVPYSGLATAGGGAPTRPFNIGVNLEFFIEGAWRNIDYPGMVIADAEELDGGLEFISAQTNASGWQLIDKYQYPERESDNYQLIFDGDDELRLQASSPKTYSQAVLFAKEATELRNVQMYGTGHSALALGFVLPFDISEGPYCEARHYIDDFDYTAPDFGRSAGTYSLGNLTESELNALPTVYIGSADDPLDNNSIPEEQLKINFVQRQIEITVNVVNLKEEDATLYWWMDFDGDGVYSPDEMKSFPNIASGVTDKEVTLVFSEEDFPEEYQGTRHLRVGDLHSRLRITTTELTDHENTPQDERACGLAMDGEVEDYIFDVRGISVSGEVFIDADGMTDDAVDGSFMGEDLAFSEQFTNPLYVYLVREGDQSIAGKTTVSGDGTYSITDMNHGYYTLMLSYQEYELENPFPAGPTNHLPLDWMVVGETLGVNNASVSENRVDEVIDGRVPIETPAAGYDITGVNFGINQPPRVADLSYSIEAYGKIEAPVLTHAEDPQDNRSVVADSLRLLDADGAPQSSITLDGIGTFSVTEAFEISFIPTRNFHGNSVSVPYVVADAAGLVSEPGLLTIEVDQPQFIMVNPILPSKIGG